ncbi:hypothetical protein PFICI_07077 [Pestalotiopsis fici W106-1]|uniref:UbiA prenyltransferase n=1 Tax=Pestalotiopsis fici (strain W106-1 / CGMCC3.15140) TaxID=1229662 RepID=W3X7P4_PESFW|nr:uncharacterized protein PFICI_07077 [Pestalotiopsis fici W106-1]ETS82075.1 hypothetical protein PFICI_07077 [Pestalotiopsis fici W106-1]
MSISSRTKLDDNYSTTVSYSRQLNKLHHERTFWFHLKTLYLFTKSDFKTVVLPQSLFAIASVYYSKGFIGSPPQIALRITLALVWIWTHLLAEDVSNQRLPDAILEDAVNEPWRPLPSKRLTAAEASLLLRYLLPIAYGLSVLLGATAPSTTLMAAIYLYNDLEGASCGPYFRNILNAAGLACFGWGAAEILLAGVTTDIGMPVKYPYEWIGLTAVIVATTVQAQDLPDIPGDEARGRQSMPLLYGELWTRASIAVLVVLWTMTCLVYWEVQSPTVWLVLLSAALSIAILTLLWLGQDWDEIVWKLWCIWTTMIFTLPLFSSAPI